MRKLVLENTAPFQGLAELVAHGQGFFEDEGLVVEWADRDKGTSPQLQTGVTRPDELDPHSSHGRLFEQGKADMYNACEWGNYCRVQDSGVAEGRQIGRRAIVTYAGLVVRPDSECYTPQQLAGKLIGVPFYFGTHYLALHMLEGFLPREDINLCSAPNGSRRRYDAMMAGDIEATTLTEPYLSLAEKNGCRVLCSSYYHGTEVASDAVDSETYAAFNRAVRRAVALINGDKRRYMQYFIDHHGEHDPEIASLTVDDMRESRIVVVDPAPIPDPELRRTAEWLKGWGMLKETRSPLELVNAEVQAAAHAAAAE